MDSQASWDEEAAEPLELQHKPKPSVVWDLPPVEAIAESLAEEGQQQPVSAPVLQSKAVTFSDAPERGAAEGDDRETISRPQRPPRQPPAAQPGSGACDAGSGGQAAASGDTHADLLSMLRQQHSAAAPAVGAAADGQPSDAPGQAQLSAAAPAEGEALDLAAVGRSRGGLSGGGSLHTSAHSEEAAGAPASTHGLEQIAETADDDSCPLAAPAEVSTGVEDSASGAQSPC